MKLLQRLCAATLVCVMTAGLSACQPKTEGAASTDGSGEAPGATRELVDLSAITDPYLATAGIAGDAVVATAGGVDITAGEVLYHAAAMADSYLNYYAYYYGQQEIPWDTEGQGTTLKVSILEDALKTAALYGILPDLAQQEGLTPNEEEVDGILVVLDQLKEAYGGEEAGAYALWQEPLTAQMYRDLVTSGVCYNQIQEKYYGENGTKKIADADVLAYAADELGYYKAKHILFKTVDTDQRDEDGNYLPLEESVIAEKKAQAEAVLAQLQAAAEKEPLFDQLMLEYSEDKSGDVVNGQEGYVAAAGQMVAAFEEGAKALKDHEISGLVESEYGYHIILRLPLEMDSSYTQSYIEDQMIAMQQQWLDNVAIEKTDSFAALDLPAFYDKLGQLRTMIGEELQARTDALDAAAAEAKNPADASVPAP